MYFGLYLAGLLISTSLSNSVSMLYFIHTGMFINAPYIYYIRVFTALLTINLLTLLPTRFWFKYSSKQYSIFYIVNISLYILSAVGLLIYSRFNSVDAIVVALDLVSAPIVILFLVPVIRYRLNEIRSQINIDRTELLLTP